MNEVKLNPFYLVDYILIKNQSVFKGSQCLFSSVGSMSEFLQEAYLHLEINYPKYFKMDTLSKLGFLASEYLLKNQDLSHISPYQKGLIFQNKSASLATDSAYAKTISDIASPALFVYTLPNIVLGEISIRHHFKGENSFFIAEEYQIDKQYEYIKIIEERNEIHTLLSGYVEFDGSNYDVCVFHLNKSELHQPALTIDMLKKAYFQTEL